jgi:hypothetical protein
MRTRPASLHLFAERANLPKVLFQFDLGDKRAFTTLTVGDARVAKRLEGLPGRHAADTQAFGNDLFGGKRFSRLQATGANVLEQVLLNLEIERNDTMPVKAKQIHKTPRLSRQLRFLYSQSGDAVKTFL